MKKLKKAIQPKYLIVILAAFLLALRVFFEFIEPLSFLQRIYHIQVNNPSRFNLFLLKTLNALLIFLLLIVFLMIISNNDYFRKLKANFIELLKKLMPLFSTKTLLWISVVYLLTLFYLSISRYDLGFDEAWFLQYAKNFSEAGLAFCTYNGAIFAIDVLTMLPMYVFSSIWFNWGTGEIWQIKLISSALSVVAIIFISYIIYRKFNFEVSVISLFLLILQPGFGFVASSFFGEIPHSLFFITALYIWLKDDLIIPNTKKLILTGLLMSLSFQTDFRMFPIIAITLIAFRFVRADKKPLAVLLYSVIFTLLISAIRFIPFLLYYNQYLPVYFKTWLLILMSGNQYDTVIRIERFHLINRLFPLTLFAFGMVGIFYKIRSDFERFLFIFTLAAFLYWIVFFDNVTYRHLFVGIIPFCILFANFLMVSYNNLIGKALSLNNFFLSRIIIAAMFLIMMIYGFSSNLKYAYVGYNDGVQFDLDGSKSMLFEPLIHDNSQKEFYKNTKESVLSTDTIYGGDWVTKSYLPNPVFDFAYFKDDVRKTPSGKRFVIITRESFPLSFKRTYSLLDSLELTRVLILKNGEHELYKVSK